MHSLSNYWTSPSPVGGPTDRCLEIQQIVHRESEPCSNRGQRCKENTWEPHGCKGAGLLHMPFLRSLPISLDYQDDAWDGPDVPQRWPPERALVVAEVNNASNLCLSSLLTSPDRHKTVLVLLYVFPCRLRVVMPATPPRYYS